MKSTGPTSATNSDVFATYLRFACPSQFILASIGYRSYWEFIERFTRKITRALVLFV